MFRLKKLDIHGFKSFVDKTTLTLPSRITAIVGPNGSGKSNICDSVQWVLGEQSARNLRGATMEDVIFNGSARRRPVGLAEVTLTLEARGDHWAETGGEVTITRRVHRSGESDYLLNGKRSRLKDVQEVLLGTGLGVRAYAIIEQQKIDLILSTKPQDRRRLIEEAAGISKFKVRKRQAELKLEETRSNLLRLRDIVSEIERTCTSLKRQAGRASRWKEQAEVLDALKRKLARLRADRLALGLAAGDKALAAATDAEAAALAALGMADAELEEAKRLHDEAERTRREKGEALARARETLLAAEAAVAAAVREGEETEARKELLLAQQREAQQEHLRSSEETGRAESQRDDVEVEKAAAEERLQVAAEALAVAARAETEAAGRRETSRRELLTTGARAADATNREREAALLVDRLTFALGKLEERKTRAHELLAEREAAVARAVDAEETAAATLEAARARLDEIGVNRRAAEERLKQLKIDRDRTVAEFHALDRRIAALETTLAERESGGAAARRALETAKLSANGVLADHFEAREGFEQAMDAALGPVLEAPVLADRAALDAALAAVKSAKLGTARFVHPISAAAAAPRLDDVRIQGVSRDLLSPRAGDESLAASLPDAIVVATLDDALALAPFHPERTIVSRDGIVVRGSVVEAAGTEVPGEGLFTVRRDLRQLQATREELSLRLTELDQEIAGTATTAGELSASLDREVMASRRAERDHSETSARVKAAREEQKRAERELALLADEETNLRTDVGRAGESRAEALRVSAQRGAEVQSVERILGELEAGVEAARAARLTAAEVEARARTARDVLRERHRAATDAAATHRRRAEDAARKLAEIADAFSQLDGRRDRAEAAGISAREARATAAEATAVAEAARAAADAAEVEVRQRRAAAEQGDHVSREALDASRKARFEAELVLERRKADHDYLVETCRNEFACAPEELPAIELAEGESLPEEAVLAEDVTVKTLALEKLGPVNHAALEEFDVESKRLQELNTQKLDLEKSLDQILETLKTINETSAERFQEAFAAINASFAQMYQRLFRGGTAAMHLLDETDPLDSGIEIMAQPPGKRNQTIGLLSGGEKALTAIALLVSIFRFKPSPFCILDEVDAPLDEANIDRFTSLLAELSEETQFVLITHSKRTMETAQALYGVTQEEPGVSKLVSVRFD